ncbi:MAG: helix-turn-helix domain-containing protein [Gemmatimonadales bacterium]
MSSARLRIKALREARGWSQLELAEHAGVRQATISELETGKARRVGLDTLERLAGALKVATGQLFEAGKRASSR